jgi:hypothetical protein
MDSSELTKNKRNRVTANSLSGGGIARPHSNITMNSEVLSSYRLGGKYIDFNKRQIFPPCKAPLCNTDDDEPVSILQHGWVTSINGSAVEEGRAVTIDTNNNVYVTGTFSSNDLDVRNHLNVTGSTINTSSFGVINNTTFESDGYVAKYDTNGQAQWATNIKGNSCAITTESIITDTLGFVYVSASVIFSAPSAPYSVDFYNFVDVTTLGPIKTINTSIAGTLDFPNGAFNEGDIILVKYDTSNGNVVWVTSIGNVAVPVGSELEYKSCLTIDSTNNIYISGNFQNQTIIYNATPIAPIISLISYGTLTSPSPTLNDFTGFIAKYNPNGIAQWATIVTGTQNTNMSLNYIDSDGTDVFITGVSDSYIGVSSLSFYYCSSQPIAGGAIGLTLGQTIPNYSNQHPFVAKIKGDGLSVPWAVRIDTNTAGVSSSNAITADPSGGVYVTGFYLSPSPFEFLNSGGFVAATLPSSPLVGSGYIVKYDTNGIVQWATNFTSTSAVEGRYVTTDSSGNLIVIGQTDSSSVLIKNYSTTSSGNIIMVPYGQIPNNGNQDVFIIKYNSDGKIIWATYAGSTGIDVSFSVSTDSYDSIVICGNYGASLSVYNFDSVGPLPNTNPINTTLYGNLPNTGDSDAFLIKYTKDGTAV